MTSQLASIESVSVRSNGKVVAPSRSARASSRVDGRPANSSVCVGANAVAMAEPIPPLAPVMSAVGMPSAVTNQYDSQILSRSFARRSRWRGAGRFTAARRSSGASAFIRVSKSELGSWPSIAASAAWRLASDSYVPPALRRDVDQYRTQVGRVTRALHQPDLLQPADGHGRGGGADPFVRGEVGHSDRAPIEQGDQNRQLGQRQLTGHCPVWPDPRGAGSEKLGQGAVQPLRQLRHLRALWVRCPP